MGLYSVTFANFANYLRVYFHYTPQMIAGYFVSYVSFLFILHALTGFIGGRLLSFRTLIAISFISTFIGGVLLIWQNLPCFYWGATLSLLGGGISIAAINCLITQLFKPEDKRRESAFLWAFALMNIGFATSYLLQNNVTSAGNYKVLYISVALLSLLALCIIASHWRNLYDRTTYLLSVAKHKVWLMNIYGGLILLAALPLTYAFLIHTHFSRHLLTMINSISLLVLLLLAIRQPSKQMRNKILAFLIFLIVSIIFWSMTLLIPSEIGVLLVHAQHHPVTGISVYAHWYQVVIYTTVVIIAPFLGALFFKLRHKGIKIMIPVQFAFGMLFLGIAFIILPLSLQSSAGPNILHGTWLVLAYILVGIAQLFVQPIGLAMVGQLAPMALQSVLMGCWMMVLGIAAFIAKFIVERLQSANAIANSHPAENHYRQAFHLMGWSAIAIAIFVLLLLPLLNKLIRYRSLNPALTKK